MIAKLLPLVKGHWKEIGTVLTILIGFHQVKGHYIEHGKQLQKIEQNKALIALQNNKLKA